MSRVLESMDLDNINVPQAKNENREFLDMNLGGVDGLLEMLNVNPEYGLSEAQVNENRARFGDNTMPLTPKKSFIFLLLTALYDTTLMILMAAAAVSFVIGYIEDPEIGWVEGVAIFIAVMVCALVSAGNDYNKELQFRALEASSAQDQQVSVLRKGEIEQINPSDLVVGDIMVLQTGDQINADAVMIDGNEIFCSEAGLTGEPIDLRKNKMKDCFLLSSCLITEGPGCKAMVIGVGISSQWGKIKANLVTEAVDTPLQKKLGIMTTYVSIFLSLRIFTNI